MSPDQPHHPTREALEALAEHAPVAVAVLEADGRVAWVNPEAERLLGERSVVVGRAFADLGFDSAERARRVSAGGTADPQPLQLRRADGTARETLWTARRLPEGSVLVMARDVTDERELAARLARAERLEAIGRLAGGIAHDFNNLLTVIAGNAQLLVELRELAGPALDEAEEIVRAADTARSVVRQLLSFTGREPRPMQVLDVNERVENLREIVPRLIDLPVSVEFELAHGLPPVRLEEGQLEQILLNLLLNARDAMPGGGRVAVRTRLAEVGAEGRRVVSGRLEAGHYVALVVDDTGHGIAAESLHRILEPFFTTKASSGGTGLGLSTVHAIVQQAGGSLDIASEPGRGCTFTIYLPAAAEGPQVAHETAAMPPAVAPATILVVDDHDAIRALCRRALEREGHRVVEAATADAAAAAAGRAGQLDLVIADVRLKGENGRELLRLLQADRPGIRVLLMSPQQRLEPSGAPVLEKPFTAAALVAAVRKALS